MGVCSVLGCRSRSREKRLFNRAHEGVTFHSFPSKNLALRARWALSIRGEGWAPSRYSKVCSKHFEERFFDRTGQTCRLKENAIPTLLIDPSRVAMAASAAKVEKVEYMDQNHLHHLDPLADAAHQSYVTVAAEAVLHGHYQCENHADVLSPDECNKLMYALDLGDGRKIKLIYSVPKGQCGNLF